MNHFADSFDRTFAKLCAGADNDAIRFENLPFGEPVVFKAEMFLLSMSCFVLLRINNKFEFVCQSGQIYEEEHAGSSDDQRVGISMALLKLSGLLERMPWYPLRKLRIYVLRSVILLEPP
ncbi:hypothetical protein [Glutamicibacter sp. NPDC127525]|uniref:hypothetical protein n=1 Tax=unclassified Glutamicibacter TaxID=2627139 RepID=UPI003640802C